MKGQVTSSQSSAKWLTQCITSYNQRADMPLPFMRSQVTSSARLRNISMSACCKAARWHPAQTFSKHYALIWQLDQMPNSREQFCNPYLASCSEQVIISGIQRLEDRRTVTYLSVLRATCGPGIITEFRQLVGSVASQAQAGY